MSIYRIFSGRSISAGCSGCSAGILFISIKEVSLALAQLTCWRERLAQGAPSSPVISNFICRRMDGELFALAAKYRIFCSRYCDDITFSTKALSFPREIVYTENGETKIGSELMKVISANSFSLNPNKIFLRGNRQRQMVTGIVVNEKPNILNARYRRFRTVLHYTWKNGYEKAAKYNGYCDEDGQVQTGRFRRHILGTVNYYKLIMKEYNPKYRKLAAKVNELEGKEVFPLPDDEEEIIRRSIFVLYNGWNGCCGQGTAFYVRGAGLVTCLHNITKNVKNIADLEEYIRENVSVFLPGGKKIPVKYVQSWETEDLCLLDFEYGVPPYGFELAKDMRPVRGQGGFTAYGYPEFVEDGMEEADCVQSLRVRHVRTYMGQEQFLVDKTFYRGSSGGPVLNAERKAVGLIDRGAGIGDAEEEGISAFCSLLPVAKWLEEKAEKEKEK